METFLGIIFIVFGILQIILFFKLWGMTNDIREIKNRYLHQASRESDKSDSDSSSTQDVSSPYSATEYARVVELKSESQMMAGEIAADGKIKCYSTSGSYIGDFDKSEIMDFNLWVKNVYKK